MNYMTQIIILNVNLELYVDIGEQDVVHLAIDVDINILNLFLILYHVHLEIDAIVKLMGIVIVLKISEKNFRYNHQIIIIVYNI